jgi:hypothetical protein
MRCARRGHALTEVPSRVSARHTSYTARMDFDPDEFVKDVQFESPGRFLVIFHDGTSKVEEAKTLAAARFQGGLWKFNSGRASPVFGAYPRRDDSDDRDGRDDRDDRDDR